LVLGIREIGYFLDWNTLVNSAPASAKSTFSPCTLPALLPSPDQHQYLFETIIPAIPVGDPTRAGIVTGWRRETGKTTTPNLYLRNHLLKKKLKLDEFVNSEFSKRLYVTGPPGSGKTLLVLLYCSQYPFNRPIKQRVLVVQFREASVCDIMIIDGYKSNNSFVGTGTTQSVCGVEAGGRSGTPIGFLCV